MTRLPKGLHDILPTYWPSINKAVTTSLRRGYRFEGQSLLADVDPTEDALGTAAWGAVYQATPRKWVVKVTADEREALAVHDLCVGHDFLRQHPGVTYYADAWQLADKTAAWEAGGYDYYTVYVLLREAVTPIANVPRLRKSKRSAQMKTALETIQDLSLGYDFGDKWMKTSVLQQLIKTEHTYPELSATAEFMRLYFLDSDFALADVHMGNLGYKPGSKVWSIFDLGHPTTTGEPLKVPLFKVLHP